MADDTTAPAPAASPDVLSQLAPYLALLQQGQAQPTHDMTPVERTWQSKVGEALGGPFLLPGMTPAEKEAAGLAALGHFGTGLLNASGNLQGGTIGTLLGRGFDAAERGALGAQQFDASTLAAQQEYAQKQQEMRIAAIKEAIPLLSLQQSQQRLGALGALPPAIGAPNIAPGGSIAAPLSSDKATALTQIAQRESGGDPTALNYVAREDPTAYARGATASGKYQIVNSTWAEGAKLAGVDVAKYPTARDAPEAVQDKVASALWDKHGNTPWQKGAQDWVKGQDGRYTLQPGAKPAAPPGGAQPPAPYQVATAGSAVPPPPGGAPAAPTTDLTGPRPLPPIGAGAPVATPASIANTPVQTTQAQPPAPAGGTGTPPAPTAPAGPPEFSYAPRPPPPGTIQGGDLTGAEQSVVQDARNSYAVAIRAASLIPDAAKAAEARAQAEATLQATLDKELTARTGRTDAGAKQLTDWYKEDFTQQRDVHKAAVDAFYKNQDTQQQLENQLKLKAAEGEQARLTNKDQAVNAANQNGLIAAQKEQAESRDKVAALEGFRAISDGVGQPGWLQTTKFPGSDKTIAEQLGQLGMPLSDTAGVQLLRGSMTNLTRELRAGLAMGTLSDRDLDFVARLGPTEWMDPDTRAAAAGYLRQAYQAKMRFASDLQKEMSRGKNYGDAFDAADAKQKPFVPSAPADITAHWTDNNPEWVQRRLQWAQQNDVRPGTLFHLSDGSIHIAKTPKPPRQP